MLYKCVEWGVIMDTKITDLRIRRTYKFLTDALGELISEKPFGEISVTDICNRAMVHRTTFYKHFEDKYQLLQVTFLDEQNSFVEKCKAASVNDTDPKFFYTRLVRQMFEYVSENKDIFKKGVLHPYNHYLTELLKNTIVSYLQDHFKEDSLKYNINYTVPIPIMAEYYAGSCISLLVWWLKTDLEISIDKMVDYMDIIISDKAASLGNHHL